MHDGFDPNKPVTSQPTPSASGLKGDISHPCCCPEVANVFVKTPNCSLQTGGGCLLNMAHSSDIGGGGVTRAAHAIGSPPFSPKSVSKFSIIMSCINQQAHCMDARAVSTCHGGKGVQTMLQESVTPSSLEKRYGVDGIDSRCSMGFSNVLQKNQ